MKPYISLLTGVVDQHHHREIDLDLWRAIAIEDAEVVERLISEGARINMIMHGYNALQFAIIKESAHIVALLLHHSADTSHLDPDHHNAVMLASGLGRTLILHQLLEKGALCNIPDHMGNTPLHLASCLGKTNIVSLLLRYHAPIENFNVNGDTPLHMAATHFHKGNTLPVVKLLLKAGLNVDSQNNAGNSALHIAVMNQDTILTRFLTPLSHVGCKNKDGLTPLDIAELAGHRYLIELLESKEKKYIL